MFLFICSLSSSFCVNIVAENSRESNFQIKFNSRRDGKSPILTLWGNREILLAMCMHFWLSLKVSLLTQSILLKYYSLEWACNSNGEFSPQHLVHPLWNTPAEWSIQGTCCCTTFCHKGQQQSKNVKSSIKMENTLYHSAWIFTKNVCLFCQSSF